MDEKQRLAGEGTDGASSLSGSNARLFFYNRRREEILGRTWKSWLQVVGFSVCFCLFVTLVFAISLWTFYQTLDSHTPKLQLRNSFIGVNPGLGFRPLRKEVHPYSSLIHFIHGGSGNWQELSLNLKNFLREYDPGYRPNAGTSQTKCHWTSGPREKDNACEFNKEWLSNHGANIKCIEEEHFGYYHGKPCILIKMNRIYGWNPEPYFNVTEVQQHPTMPESLKKHIAEVWKNECEGKGEDVELRCPKLNMVWLHCDGETDPDKENIGRVTYTPYRGFPAYYFPFYNQIGYLTPVVMLQLESPTPGVLMNIECTPWAKGIVHDRKTRRGLVHFELLMD